MNKFETKKSNPRTKVLLPIIIRGILLVLIIFFKDEIFNSTIAMMAVLVLLIWSIYDFVQRRKNKNPE
jgi:c-di-AMP phosphodiesterase-like protein